MLVPMLMQRPVGVCTHSCDGTQSGFPQRSMEDGRSWGDTVGRETGQGAAAVSRGEVKASPLERGFGGFIPSHNPSVLRQSQALC